MSIQPAKAYEGEICVVCQGSDCDWSPSAIRAAYDASITAFTEAGVTPNRLGSRGKWGSFRHKRHHLERTDFKDVRFMSLSHRIDGEEYSERAFAYASLQPAWRSFELSWLPSLIGEPAKRFHELFKELAILSRMQYGYRHWRRMAMPQPVPPPPGPEAPESNPSGPKQKGALLLSGVYSHNYLSHDYLDAPVGYTHKSLREWIEDDPAQRGELMPFTDILMEWTPPPKRIPWIRESLFRAGRLYYHRFFKALDYERVVSRNGEIALRNDLPWQRDPSFTPIVYPPEPYYRPNIHEPWEATGPTPEIFQAARYHELFQDKRPT